MAVEVCGDYPPRIPSSFRLFPITLQAFTVALTPYLPSMAYDPHENLFKHLSSFFHIRIGEPQKW